MHRRDLLLLAALAPFSNVWAKAAADQRTPPGTIPPQRTLILVELKGGNDGLNTLVPYTDPAYYRLRPRLAIPADEVLPLSESIGMHPALASLLPAWREGDLAWAQGLGYADPNLSHFRSLDIWETASDADETLTVGWLAQVLPARSDNAWPDVLTFGGGDGVAQGGALRVVTMQTPEAFVKQAERLPEDHRSVSTTSALDHVMMVDASIRQTATELQEALLDSNDKGLPDLANTTFGRQLRQASRIILNDIPVPVIKVALAGFDTHTNQSARHARLLTELAEALAAFRAAMIAANRWDDLLVMTYSEFGRRVPENNQLGTDHGTAAPHLVMGGAVNGGLYGEAPALAELNQGNLRYTTEFRRVYATIAQRWWRLGEARWGQRFAPMDWLATSGTASLGRRDAGVGESDSACSGSYA